MRLTPAQLGVHMICGEELVHTPDALIDRVREGRELLRQVTGRDFGYDLQSWHDHLKESREGGYTWARTIDLPRIMKEALASKAWQAVVAKLEAEPAPAAGSGGETCPKCGNSIPHFPELSLERKGELRRLAAKATVSAIKELRAETGCDLRTAKVWVEHLEHHGPPCPQCEKPLRTDKAQQCLECGADWHGQAG